jgi:FMN phosphatase YigB (HAD superfamily)
MKVILVDAVNAFVIPEKGIFHEMHILLERYPNRKIILTGANDEQMEKFGLNNMPYEVFTLKHNPEKKERLYYSMMLRHFNLQPRDVVYFEHNMDAVKSARGLGIETLYYNKEKRDLVELERFLDRSL